MWVPLQLINLEKMKKTEPLNGRKSRFLKPSDFCLTTEPMVIKTVLGSCLTITMFSRKAGAAAACHATLPSCKDHSCLPGACENKYKFVECVIPEMLRRFQELGVGSGEIEIKMFGGADMIMVRKGSKCWDNQRVGRKNILMAREIVRNLQLRVMKMDVGGTLGRQLQFDTKTGEVWMKRLSRIDRNEGGAGDPPNYS